MFKSLVPSIIAVSLSAAAFAQSPTLTDATISPIIGETYQLKVCNPAGVMPGTAGANQVWNFTGLSVTSTEMAKVVSCLSTPNCASYPGSTKGLIEPAPAHVTSYISTGTTKMTQYGVWQAADTNLILSDPIEQLRYPFTYGDTYSDNYAGILRFGPLTAHETGSVTVTADAYGKLMLPGRTDTALRIHTLQLFRDSTFIFGSAVIQNFTIETFSWYKPGYHAALMTINTVTNVSSGTEVSRFVSFAPKNITAVGNTPAPDFALQLAPNPASGELLISFDAPANEAVAITISDMLGRTESIMAGTYSGPQRLKYNVTNRQRGIYLVRMQAGAETVTRKIELQ
ncbi:MAG: T9SS type A sorting domain-containing protein [Bacteroidota bacterium]